MSIQAIEARVAKLETALSTLPETDFAMTFALVHVCILWGGFLAFALFLCVDFDEKNQLKMRYCRFTFHQMYISILVLLRDWLSRLIESRFCNT